MCLAVILDERVPYVETDSPFPLNVYGTSKLAGEYFARAIAPRHFVVRSSGLYGPAGSSGKGGNFVELMLRLAREDKPIRVVNDQRLTPTYTVDLAEKIVELISNDAYGLYHITSESDCSWYEFAGTIFKMVGLSPNFKPTMTAEFGAKAIRPSYSVLKNFGIRNAKLTEMRSWQDALRDYLKRKGYLQ